MKIKPCPYCGGIYNINVRKILSRRLPFWYWIKCDLCHCSSKPKLFLRRAVKYWNKMEKYYNRGDNNE